MRIDRVTYHYLANLGDYQNERIELSAVLEEGETPEEAIAKLKQQVLAMAGKSYQSLEKERWNLAQEVKKLEEKLKKAQADWDAMAEFLRVQGIKPDAPISPVFANLLPSSQEVEVLDAVPF